MASRVKDRLTASASGFATASIAAAHAAMTAPTREEAAAVDHSGLTITPKASGKFRPYRRLVQYHRVGPLHRQVGIKIIAGKELPMMQTYFVHHFMHATKGPRKYSGGPSIRMPYAPQAVSPRVAFYGGIRARKRQLLAAQAKEHTA